MSSLFDIMYEWSNTLENERIDEDHQEIQFGNRTVLNQIIRLQGNRGDVPVVVSWEDFFSVSDFTSMAQRYVRHVLEVFIGDKSVKLEGSGRPRGLLDKLLGLIGLRRGYRPGFNHVLFTECLIEKKDKDTDTRELEDRAFCQELHTYLTKTEGLWKVEMQAESGMSSYFITKQVSPRLLDTTVDSMVALLAARGSSGA